MVKIHPYLLDIVVGVVFILLPRIRGYKNWQIHEYGLLLLIYGYIVYLHHKKWHVIVPHKNNIPILSLSRAFAFIRAKGSR